MSEKSKIYLENSGYSPYYLYRQKNIADNLENIGFCLPAKQCKYNISYMEDANSVIGLGAGAVSKFIDFKNNIINRYFNKKNIVLYSNDIKLNLQNDIRFTL